MGKEPAQKCDMMHAKRVNQQLARAANTTKTSFSQSRLKDVKGSSDVLGIILF